MTTNNNLLTTWPGGWRRTMLYAVLLLTTTWGCRSGNGSTKATRQDIVEAVYASGTVQPQNYYKVFAMVDGYVKQRMVNEGDGVQGGQLLFHIESDEQQLRRRISEEQYRLARTNQSPALAEAQAAMENARARMENDSTNHQRYRNLFAQNVVAQADLDRAQLAWRVSKNDFVAASQRYQRTRNQLQTETQTAENQLAINNTQESNYYVRSRYLGRVYEVYKEQGEAVRRNEAIAMLGQGGEVFLQLAVDEQDVRRVHAGQTVLVKADAYTGRVFKARVSKVYPMLNKQEQTFRVDATLTDSLPAHFAGMQVEANIIIQEKKQALTLPVSYVQGDSLWVMQDGERKRVPIRRGAQNFTHVEVLSGITEETEVLPAQ